MWLYVRQKTRVVQRPSEGNGEPGDEYLDLIQFLLDSGADPNVLSSEPRWSSSVGGTAFDLFASYLLIKNTNTSPGVRIRSLALYKKLLAHGCEFSKPIQSTKGTHPRYLVDCFAVEISELRQFPEQIECK
jgi:hypothetical protein